MNAQIEHNFKYHPPVGNAADLHARVRKHCQATAEFCQKSCS